MAKTNPIGVRFDEEILEQIKVEQKLTSPQKVLNYLMENYRNCVLNTEKGVTIINPNNGVILEDHPNPPKNTQQPKNKTNTDTKKENVTISATNGLNDIERLFEEEKRKLKNK